MDGSTRWKSVICVLALAAALGIPQPGAAQEEAAPEAPAVSLKADPAKDKEAGKRLPRFIREKAEQGDFDGLDAELASRLKADFPKAFADSSLPPWKAPPTARTRSSRMP